MTNEFMTNEYKGPEKRKSKRITACFTVTYKLSKQIEIQMWLKGREFSAIMLDLGPYGMAILTEKNIPALAMLSINFTLINEFVEKDKQFRPMEMEGEIRYNIKLKERTHRLGILFTQISEDDRFEITKFIKMVKIWDSSFSEA